MALPQPEQLADDRLRCVYCGDVIGVYEVLVHLVGGRPEKSSRAAQPSLSTASPGVLYHFVCYGLDHTQPHVRDGEPRTSPHRSGVVAPMVAPRLPHSL
ncbi:MAG TPA: hypothetical protein VMP89_16405 [Solirubrobacteraceae bacterium]|nr:hypothetical protein [Solirubrobacteraceae bacterium]